MGFWESAARAGRYMANDMAKTAHRERLIVEWKLDWGLQARKLMHMQTGKGMIITGKGEGVYGI